MNWIVRKGTTCHVVSLSLLIILAATQFFSGRQENQTNDEASQMVSGYYYLKTGVYSLGLEHPPLAKILWALPLLPLDPDLPPLLPPEQPNTFAMGWEFLYHNRVPADTLLLASRCSAIAISVLLGLAVLLWTRAHFGLGAAILALFLCCFDPNIIAHGRYAKNDVLLTLFFFLACATWGAYLAGGTRRYLFAAGTFLGLAISTKYSALILVPLFVLLYFVRWWQTRAFQLSHMVRSFAAAGASAALVVYAAYGFETQSLFAFDVTRTIRNCRPNGDIICRAWLALPKPSRIPSGVREWTVRAAQFVPVPAPAFFRGIGTVAVKENAGVRTYILGRNFDTSPWYLSPVVFAVKTPAATLALLCLACLLALRRLVPFHAARLRQISFLWYVLVIPPVIFFVAAMASRMNFGFRHLLPIFPFLFVFIAAVLTAPRVSARAARITAAVFATVLLFESAFAYPDYLAFFNWPSGGSRNGPKYLAEANVEWGQGVKKLKTYLDSHNVSNVCVDYFGNTDLHYYGIEYRPLPAVSSLDAARSLDCPLAISITKLCWEQDKFRWLKGVEPDARIGGSIYFYDLRKNLKDLGLLQKHQRSGVN